MIFALREQVAAREIGRGNHEARDTVDRLGHRTGERPAGGTAANVHGPREAAGKAGCGGSHGANVWRVSGKRKILARGPMRVQGGRVLGTSKAAWGVL